MSLNHVKQKLFRQRYEIGFLPYDEKIVVSGKKIKPRFIKNPPKDKWYADPFLLEVTDKNFVVLVEEFRYGKIGRIAKLEVDRKSMNIVSEVILLDLPTHLSFPIFYRDGEDIYIYPENCASGSLSLYKYNRILNVFTYVKTLVDRPLTDAVVYHDVRMSGGGYYLLATDCRKEDGSNDEMLIFHSDRIDGDYEQVQIVNFDRKIARNAGVIVNIKGVSYRVAQDCTKSYGYSMIFQKIKNDEQNMFSFENVSQILPRSLWYGTHTFNVCGDWAVVDVNVAVYPLIRRLYFGLASYFKMIFRKLGL